MLAAQGRVEELTVRADKGDRAAQGRLAELLAAQGRVEELTARADKRDLWATKELANPRPDKANPRPTS